MAAGIQHIKYKWLPGLLCATGLLSGFLSGCERVKHATEQVAQSLGTGGEQVSASVEASVGAGAAALPPTENVAQEPVQSLLPNQAQWFAYRADECSLDQWNNASWTGLTSSVSTAFRPDVCSGPVSDNATCIRVSREANRCRSFGHIVARELCMRITDEVDKRDYDAGRRTTYDDTGAMRMPLCDHQVAPAYNDDPLIVAIYNRYDDIKMAIDLTFGNDAMLDQLNLYLKSINRLIDEKVVDGALLSTASLLDTLKTDTVLSTALAQLINIDGFTPAVFHGKLARQVLALPGLDAFMRDGLSALMSGPVQSGERDGPLNELVQVQAALAQELLRTKPTAALFDPDRPMHVVRNLLLRTTPAIGRLYGAEQASLLLAERDPRGLPVLARLTVAGSGVNYRPLKDAYFVDAQGQRFPLAEANELGSFLVSSGLSTTYVSPFKRPASAEPVFVVRNNKGQTLDARDANQSLLYRYTDLRPTLLYALMNQVQPMFQSVRKLDVNGQAYDTNIPGGLLNVLSLVSGPRKTIVRSPVHMTAPTYQGLDIAQSPLLDAVHASAELLRVKETEPLLRGALTIINQPQYESAVARLSRTLVDLYRESLKNTYQNAALDKDSPLFDDLAPILARMLTAQKGLDGKTLIEDLTTALGQDASVAMGPLLAQLMDQRGYFFMRQPNNIEIARGFMDPVGVTGSFNASVNRALPDSDQSLNWRNEIVNDPNNNRSVFQRLLNVVADANKNSLCNGRNIDFLTVRFRNNCDLFKVDNVAPFFLLSMASLSVRMEPATGAKQAASFREAVAKGNVCQDTKNPANVSLCRSLLSYIGDNAAGDDIIQGLIGIKGFGRFPSAMAASRVLFLDLEPAQPLAPADFRRKVRNLVYNFDAAGNIDTADADGRAFIDANGRKRPYISEHNGVLFALEQGLTSGGGGNLYAALQPVVDAFAKHAETCVELNPDGSCKQMQNAIQILADLLAVLHKHYPSENSGRLGRSFVESYGPQVYPKGKGLVSFEQLLTVAMNSDLLPALSTLSKIMVETTVDGQTMSRLAENLAAFMLVPTAQPMFTDRSGNGMALRKDGQLAYQDPVLTQALGFDPKGRMTPYYLLKQALSRMSTRLDSAGAVTTQAKRALADLADVYLGTEKAANCQCYRFTNRAWLPMADVLVRFADERVQHYFNTHATTTLSFPQGRVFTAGQWPESVVKDAEDALSNQLYVTLIDLGLKLDAQEAARKATYQLMTQLFNPQDLSSMDALVLNTADAVQLMDSQNLMQVLGSHLSPAADTGGPLIDGLRMAKQARDLTNNQSFNDLMYKVLYNAMVAQCNDYATPGLRLMQSILNIHRPYPAQGAGDVSAQDVRGVMEGISHFLQDKKSGVARVLDIVRAR